MPAIYAALAEDAGRNEQIFDDVLKALEAKRSPIVLTAVSYTHLDVYKRQILCRTCVGSGGSPAWIGTDHGNHGETARDRICFL